ncbi:hypothetical protein NDU88_007341 [Pleurodeles waltl]|uniref:Uncharacterized protein n=1 Tax=Pleurodeles waltl TaxID=8319 RepID=A0AAV7LZJ8_PLEWA|nr:hypothetical protein NDU88_001525 [Pleurodeles waltl]KAJ1101138.1 hypothetical protein NDU88_006210 [Pleurodeles waltl]KAJ1119155.1 hypothetical protein NDU88_007341 [Pleurodeles waltl]
MSPGQPGKFAQACFVGRASGDKERWKHGAAQGGEAAVQRVVRGSVVLQICTHPSWMGKALVNDFIIWVETQVVHALADEANRLILGCGRGDEWAEGDS